VRIVLDTNVLVSGLLSPHGPPGRILDLILAGELVLVVDDRILSEYHSVLARPRFGFRRADRDALFAYLKQASEAILASPVTIELPDAGDLPFLETALEGHVESLVTGNLRHFPKRIRGPLRVESPDQFLERYLEKKQ
jgi:putative PIN family toxin of toxin-antitoxin system